MEIRTIGVLGAGLMGTGLTLTAVQSGFEVILKDISSDLLEKSITEIKDRIKRLVEKEIANEPDAKEMIERIILSVDDKDLAKADFVIEAVTENLKLKQDIFMSLNTICNPSVVFATNTSCLTVTEIAGVNPRADRIIGMHFFYPVPLMKLVEITPGLKTSKETIAIAEEVAKKLGKTAVLAKDTPGFIVNRLIVPFINEAIKLVEEGVKPEDIDIALKFGANHPMGPIELADFISLDGLLNSLNALYYGFGNDKYKPSLLLKKMVQSGNLGRKNKKGFYNYE